MDTQANSSSTVFVPVDFPVIFDLEQRYLEGRAIGIHSHGLLVAAPEPLIPDSHLTVVLLMDFARNFEYRGQVMYLTEDVTVPAFDDSRFLVSILLQVLPGHELIQRMEPRPLLSQQKQAA